MTRSKYLTIGAALLATVAVPALAIAHGGGDRDGATTSPRAERMIERFEAMDTNKDGVVTRDELAAHRAARLKAADSDGDGLLSAEEFAAMHDGGKVERAQRMVRWLDGDGDGKLSLDELGFMGGRMMAHVDRDGNGSVDKIELGRMIERMARHHGGKGGYHGGRHGGHD
ncbi:MAG: calcium sensor EFh [Alphaproteobacteria bacterium]|nr:calcium sensor EFh [Alphaproteobacteria bacterium]